MLRKLREVRLARGWTQSELAGRLGLSQARLSVVERGEGSISAEQFVAFLALSNLSIDEFLPPANKDSAYQNALARLGAHGLREDPGTLPSARLATARDAIREVLVSPDSPRLVTALAPVLVSNIDGLKLQALHRDLAELGLGHRLGWLAENVRAALEPPSESVRGRDRVRALSPHEEANASFLLSFVANLALVEPTETGLRKSILDATAPVRSYLFAAGVHDYDSQAQGHGAKVRVAGRLLSPDAARDAVVSLYRPETKHGDPRIWISGLKHLAQPRDVIALLQLQGVLGVVNLTRQDWASLSERELDRPRPDLDALRGARASRGARVSTAQWALRGQVARVELDRFLEIVRPPAAPKDGGDARDRFDTHIASARTVADVGSESSDISRRWGILSVLQPADFREALDAAFASG